MVALRYRLAGRAMRLWSRVLQPRTFGVRAILLDAAGRVVLVRHYYIAGWYLPGGGVDRRESAADAIRRELREEVGLSDASIDGIQGVYHNVGEGKDDHVIVYVSRVTASDAIHAADAREIAEVGWFAIDALPPDTSPATRRRIDEHRTGRCGHGAW